MGQFDRFVCRGRIGLIHCQASCCCITNSASICDVTALNYWIEPYVNVTRFRVRRNYIFHVRITVFHHALESLHFAIRCLNTMADIFANNILHFIFLRWILIPISLEVTLVGSFDSKSTLVQVVAWQEIVTKSSPVLVTQFIRCVKGHQRVKCAQTHDGVIKWKHFLALCAGNSLVTGEFPAQRPVTRSFDGFFDLRLNKRLSKQPWGWWFETPLWSLWRHCNVDQCCYIFFAKKCEYQSYKSLMNGNGLSQNTFNPSRHSDIYIRQWNKPSDNGLSPVRHQAIICTNATRC